MSSDILVTLIVIGAFAGFVYWCTTQKWLGKWKISWELYTHNSYDSYYSYETYDGTPTPYTTYTTNSPTPYSTYTPMPSNQPIQTRGPNEPSEVVIDLKLFGTAEITTTIRDEPVKVSYTYIVQNPDSAKNVSIVLTPKEKGPKVNLIYDKENDELKYPQYLPFLPKRIASFYNNF